MAQSFLFIGNLGAGETILIALLMLLLFGSKKIPALMKGIGKNVSTFKEGVNNVNEILKTVSRNSPNKLSIFNKPFTE